MMALISLSIYNLMFTLHWNSLRAVSNEVVKAENTRGCISIFVRK